MSENTEKIKNIINKLEAKDYTIYFFAIDSNGNPNAGVAQIYKMATHLKEGGHNVGILVEKDTQKDAGAWIGKDYLGLPHFKAEGLKIKSEDILVIPEMFSSIMETAKNFPCKKVVLAQNYTYALDVLEIGVKWSDFNFNDAIVTNENMKQFVNSHFPLVKTQIIPVSIDPIFKDKKVLRKPTILIGARDTNKMLRFIKSFYLKFPMYSWITFKQIGGLTPDQLMDEMNKSAALLWLDAEASFGTLPLEAMACGLPVVGLTPVMTPEWMNGKNGLWIESEFDLVDAVDQYLGLWIEEQKTIKELSSNQAIVEAYTLENQKEKTLKVFDTISKERQSELEQYLTATNEK